MIEIEMTSLEIAEMAGMEHRNVLRSIRSFTDKDASYLKYIEWTEYKNKRGQYHTLAVLSGELLTIFILRYKFDSLIRTKTLRENAALTTIEQIKGVKLERQHPVKNSCGFYYRIDGYDKENNVAYEIDEEHHDYKKEQDYEREQFICNSLGCKFVRIKV